MNKKELKNAKSVMDFASSIYGEAIKGITDSRDEGAMEQIKFIRESINQLAREDSNRRYEVAEEIAKEYITAAQCAAACIQMHSLIVNELYEAKIRPSLVTNPGFRVHKFFECALACEQLAVMMLSDGANAIMPPQTRGELSDLMSPVVKMGLQNYYQQIAAKVVNRLRELSASNDEPLHIKDYDVTQDYVVLRRKVADQELQLRAQKEYFDNTINDFSTKLMESVNNIQKRDDTIHKQESMIKELRRVIEKHAEADDKSLAEHKELEQRFAAEKKAHSVDLTRLKNKIKEITKQLDETNNALLAEQATAAELRSLLEEKEKKAAKPRKTAAKKSETTAEEKPKRGRKKAVADESLKEKKQ